MVITIFIFTMHLNSQQATDNNRQPTSNRQQLTANMQQQTANSQLPTGNRQQQSANRQQQSANSRPATVLCGLHWSEDSVYWQQWRWWGGSNVPWCYKPGSMSDNTLIIKRHMPHWDNMTLSHGRPTLAHPTATHDRKCTWVALA